MLSILWLKIRTNSDLDCTFFTFIKSMFDGFMFDRVIWVSGFSGDSSNKFNFAKNLFVNILLVVPIGPARKFYFSSSQKHKKSYFSQIKIISEMAWKSTFFPNFHNFYEGVYWLRFFAQIYIGMVLGTLFFYQNPNPIFYFFHI